MSKNSQMIKLLLSLLLCTMVIFTSSYFGPKAIGKLKKEGSQTVSSTKVKDQPAKVPAQMEQETELNQATMNLKEIPDDLHAAISAIPKIELPAQASFSFLGLVKKQKLETLSSEALSIVATGIYQTILPSNFVIEERNISAALPDYASLGDEALLDFAKTRDLAFFNPNNSNYTLEFQLSGNNLTIILKGKKFPYEYKIVKNNEETITPKTIVQYSPLLSTGHTTLKNAGRNGETIEVYRQVYKGELIVNTESISKDFYPPEYRVEIHALAGSASQSTTAAGQTDTSAQQTATSGQDQNGTAGQSTATSTNGTTSNSSTDSDLWGKPNEQTK